MKTKLMFLMMAFFVTGVTMAQDKKMDKEEKKEEMESQKVAFITNKLDLTTDESKVFWPVYDAKEAEVKAVRKQIREQVKEGKNLDEMTDDEVKEMMKEVLKLKQDELDIETKYNAKFQEVLPVKKVAKLYMAERKFNEEVLRAWKEKQGEGKGKAGDK